MGIWINFGIGIYALVTGLIVAYNIDWLLESVQMVLQYSFIMYAVYYLASKTKNGINWVLVTVNIAALICCAFLLYHPYSRINGRYSLSERNNPNTLGVILVVGIFSVAYGIKPSIKHILIALPQIGIMLYGVIMTGSRKSLIAALVIIALALWEVLKEVKKHLSTNQLLLVLVVFTIIMVVGSKYLLSFYRTSRVAERMQIMQESHEEDENRILFYKRAWEILLEKPFFGGGLNQFRFWSGFNAYAHSTYAEAIADFGIIGCIIYFFPLIITGRIIIHNAFFYTSTYKNRLLVVLFIVEVFLGFGQIFFLDFVHFLAWTILYFCGFEEKKSYDACEEKRESRRKYIK